MLSQLTSQLRKLLRQRTTPATPAPVGPTWDVVLAEYLNSARFRTGLASATQKVYRGELERWLRDANLGTQPVSALT